jgi:hypothetical protein
MDAVHDEMLERTIV